MSLATRTWGTHLLPDGRCRFRLWAPTCEQVQVQIAGLDPLPMKSLSQGWHELLSLQAPAGTRYQFLLPDGRQVADPASLFQPEGINGPSEVINMDFPWQHRWRGRPWHEAVLYELHVGTFTPQGTFRAVIEKLPHLVRLGITAIELMPVATFPGTRNWGYDGVFPFAPSPVYGRPEDLQALVDAAHGLGLMVLLDVVYNHFGPEGNLLALYAPSFFNDRHHTPWGAGMNFEGEQAVRQFFVQNALSWLGNYQLDGLRLDAVHAIADSGPVHIIDEICATVRRQFVRPTHLLLENEHNESHRLVRGERATRYTAQWNDDLHHVLHVAATGESAGYYADYHDPHLLGRAIAQGFAFQGEWMPYRNSARGEPSAGLPPEAFVAFLQNHDQIGNRAMGDRITTLAPLPAVRAVAAIYLLLPQIPMLFMGEEWGATQPWPFFCDFAGELGQAILAGRRNEFSRFPEFSSAAQRASIPDPLSRATFESAILRWADMERPAHRQTLDWYRSILAVRHHEIIPRLAMIRSSGEAVRDQAGVLQVHWLLPSGSLKLAANLQAPAALAGPDHGRVLWQEGEWDQRVMGPWCVRWTLAESA